MIYGIYSMRDVKTGFLQPSLEVNDMAAIRNFQHAVTHSEGLLSSFSKDYSLYKIGTFDTDSAVLVPLTPIAHLAEASDALLAMAHVSGGDV